jgi:aminopeptidase N
MNKVVLLLLGVCLFPRPQAVAQAPQAPLGFWAPLNAPLVHYRIEGRIQSTSTLDAEFSETVDFTNTTGRIIQQLALNGVSECEREPEITAKGYVIETVSRDELSKILSPVSLILTPPLVANAALHLDIKATCRMDDSVPGEDIFQHWYPQIWWGYSTGDDYDVKITVPEGYVLVTSGRPDPKTGWNHQERVRDFGMFLAKNVQVKEAEAGDVLVRVVFRPKGAECADLLSATAVNVINFYRKRFGFYPYRSLTIIPGGADPVGGYPVSTAIVAIHGEETYDSKADNTHWRWITAHEAAHEYWSEYVPSADGGWGWLMIGLGLYADREYSRSHGMGHQHRDMMNGYIDGVRQGYDTTAGRTPEQEDALEWDYGNIVVHDKGLSIISALATVMGPAAFDRAYVRALREFAGRPMTSDDFAKICEQESQQDLGWFFDQWVRSDRFLSYQIASQHCQEEAGIDQCQVKVKCLGTLKMPVPVTAEFEDGTHQTQSTDRWADVSVLKFRSNSPMKSARLDPDDDLAMVVPPPAMTRAKLSEAIGQLGGTGSEAQALDLFRQAKEMAGVSQFDWLNLGLALYQGTHYSEALEALTRGEQTANGGPGLWKFACIAWQGAIMDLQNRRSEALERYQLSLELLKPYPWLKVKIDKYGVLIDRPWIQDRLKTPFQHK